MSTELIQIGGEKEIHLNTAKMEVSHGPTILYVTSFSGGKKGPMIQLTPQDSYIQLDRDGVKLLIATLIEWL